MTELRIRAAGPEDLDTVLAFWKTAAEGTSISDDRDGVERLVARDPEALILAERNGELVGTVIAGDGAAPFDHQLAAMRDRLEEAFGQRSYKLLKREDRGVSWGDQTEFEVPGGHRLRVQPKEARSPGVALSVALSHGDKTLMDTEVTVGSEGRVMVGGPKLDQGFLIIWIGAREEASRASSPPAQPAP